MIKKISILSVFLLLLCFSVTKLVGAEAKTILTFEDADSTNGMSTSSDSVTVEYNSGTAEDLKASKKKVLLCDNFTFYNQSNKAILQTNKLTWKLWLDDVYKDINVGDPIDIKLLDDTSCASSISLTSLSPPTVKSDDANYENMVTYNGYPKLTTQSVRSNQGAPVSYIYNYTDALFRVQVCSPDNLTIVDSNGKNVKILDTAPIARVMSIPISEMKYNAYLKDGCIDKIVLNYFSYGPADKAVTSTPLTNANGFELTTPLYKFKVYESKTLPLLKTTREITVEGYKLNLETKQYSIPVEGAVASFSYHTGSFMGGYNKTVAEGVLKNGKVTLKPNLSPSNNDLEFRVHDGNHLNLASNYGDFNFKSPLNTILLLIPITLIILVVIILVRRHKHRKLHLDNSFETLPDSPQAPVTPNPDSLNSSGQDSNQTR